MKIILKYFPNLDRKQRQQFGMLYELYSEWNTKINVISRKDIENLYEHHVLHSLGIANVIDFKKGTMIMDVGTGGGFPGIPLAIIFPEVYFLLVDSIGKKIKVVNKISEELTLENVKAENMRAEQVTGKFDFIISRAVSDIPALYKWVKDKISNKSFNALPNGILCMKGGDISKEIERFKSTTVYKLNDYFTEEYFMDKKIVYIKVYSQY